MVSYSAWMLALWDQWLQPLNLISTLFHMYMFFDPFSDSMWVAMKLQAILCSNVLKIPDPSHECLWGELTWIVVNTMDQIGKKKRIFKKYDLLFSKT